MSGEVLGEEFGLAGFGGSLEFEGVLVLIVFVEDADSHVELAPLKPGAGSDGSLAAGPEEAEKLALGGDAGLRLAVVDGGEDGLGGEVVGAALDGNGALTGGGEKLRGVKDVCGDALAIDGNLGSSEIEKVEADESGGGEEDGVERFVTKDFADAGGDVSPDFDDLEVWPEEVDLAGAAHAAGADAGALGKGVEGVGIPGDEDVLGGCALEDGGDDEAGGKVGGNVFEAVDGGVDLLGFEGDLEFLDEDALIDMRFRLELGKAEILTLVPGGLDDLTTDFETGLGGFQQGGNGSGLGEGEFAAAGAEGKVRGGH